MVKEDSLTGVPIKKTAKKLGRSIHSIYMKRSELGCASKTRGRYAVSVSVDGKTVAKIKKLRRAGVASEDIAKALGISMENVVECR